MLAAEAEGLQQPVVVLLGEGDGDAAVTVLDQLLPQEDERLSWGKDADMLQIEDGRKLANEVAGCL